VATYDVAGHPLLSEAASALSPERLEAEAEVAAVVLFLDDARLEAESRALRTATSAVVRQINYQLELGAGGGVLASARKGDQSVSYRGREDGVLPTAELTAWRLARRVVPLRTRFVP
jgi:hypothetical protein